MCGTLDRRIGCVHKLCRVLYPTCTRQTRQQTSPTRWMSGLSGRSRLCHPTSSGTTSIAMLRPYGFRRYPVGLSANRVSRTLLGSTPCGGGKTSAQVKARGIWMAAIEITKRSPIEPTGIWATEGEPKDWHLRQLEPGNPFHKERN